MKEQMQENLKKAFMRSVCALNFEAMNILDPNAPNQPMPQQALQQNQINLIEHEMNKQLSLVNKQMTPAPEQERLQSSNLVTPMSS